MTATALYNPPEKHWERAIVAISLNTFFASVEQLDNPKWCGRPVGILNDARGNLLFCCSDEADASGVRKGMNINAAKRICPDFIQIRARYDRYTQISNKILKALGKISLNIEASSVNQFYVDITQVQKTFGSPELIVELIKQTIKQSSGGISCTLGLAGDKTTASYAAKQNRLNGITIIPPSLSEQRLSNVPLSELEEVSKSTALFLAKRGIHRCGDMKNVPIERLAKHFGAHGQRLWYMAQGLDPAPVQKLIKKNSPVFESQVLPANTRDPEIIKSNLNKLCNSISIQLTKRKQETSRILFAIRLDDGGWIGKTYKLQYSCNDTALFLQLGLQLLDQNWKGESVNQIQISALEPKQIQRQTDLFQAINIANIEDIPSMSCANDNIQEPKIGNVCNA